MCGKRKIAYLLSIVMMISLLFGSNTYAADDTTVDNMDITDSIESSVSNETDTDETKKDGTDQETVNQDISVINSDNIEDNDNNVTGNEENINTEGEENAGGISSAAQGLINYVSVDYPYLEAPNEQNIVVSYGDGSENVTDARLLYQSDEGDMLEMSLSKHERELFLFSAGFDETDTGVYTLTDFIYVQDAVEQTIHLSDIGIESMFGVNEEYPGYGKANDESVDDADSRDLEISVVDVETGEVSEAENDIENAITATKKQVNSIQKSRVATQRSDDLVVVLDPGHGGSDGGASANGLVEKELNLKIAQYCKEELEQYSGVTVRMTRTDDTYSTIKERVDKAYNMGADVLVSIHINSSTSSAANGAEVYYPNANYNPTVHEPGRNLAQQIQNQLVSLGLTNRGIWVRDTVNDTYPNGTKQDYYGIIRYSKEYGFPGIIVEHAFISNPSDAAKLSQESFLKQLGIADATGIANAYGLSKNPEANVYNKNDYEGTLQLRVTGVGNGANVAVWSEEGGQDDIHWYSFAGSSQTIDIDIADYKNTKGKYFVHVYTLDNTQMLCTSSFYFSTDTSSKVTAESLGGEEKEYSITVEFADMPDSITDISIPVWHATDQSDIIWYTAKKVSENAWQTTVNIDDYKTSGSYTAHVYATAEDGSRYLIGNTGFTVSEVSFSVRTDNYDQTAGTFDVFVENISSASGVDRVQIPVWSASDQSNIVWYDGQRQADGSYKATVNIADHAYGTGTYKVHVYLTAGNGVTGFTSTSQEVKLPEMKISADNLDGKEMEYSLKITNAGQIRGLRNVQFATWSMEGGQDDIIWYSGRKSGVSDWEATASIQNHKTVGEYAVHVYGTLLDGSLKLLGTTEYTVSSPQLSVRADNYDQTAGTFDVFVENISSASGVDRVQIPVWSASDQSNIVWYDGQRQADGSYKATVNIADHAYGTGTYKVHVYLTAGNGVTGFTSTSQEVKLPEMKISADNLDGKEMEYSLKITNAGQIRGLRNVQFATWSMEGGQDDIIWYSGRKSGVSDWEATASIQNHKTVGEYAVHVYGTLLDGSLKLLGTTEYTVSSPQLSVRADNYDQTAGTFDVFVENISSASGVDRVQIPVWSASDQSNIVWYDGQRQEDGSYKATVNIADHAYGTGTYKVHVYLTAGNGVTGFTSTSQEVKLPEMKISADNLDGKEMEYSLKITNAGQIRGLRNVQFATWSMEGGQDDIIWYSGRKSGVSDWEATASIQNHKTAGEYAVHVYGTLLDGSLKLLGTTEYTVSSPQLSVRADNYDQAAGTFDVFVENISSASGVDRVQIPVWSASDQSNIVWYDGQRQADESYKATVNIADHAYGTGTYKVHVYLTAGNGVTGFTSTSQEVKLPGMKISADNLDGKEMEYSLKITNAGQIRGLRNVQFATWSMEGGQDDIIWYSGRKSGVSDWEATASIQNHKTAGEYAVHVYGTLLDGSLKLLGTTKFYVSNATASEVVATDYDSTTGSFNVRISGIEPSDLISRVQVPVWSASNQSDIVWYDAQKQGDGTWVANVDPIFHNYNSGNYTAHVYVTLLNGVQALVGTTSQNVVSSKYYTIMGDTTVTISQMVRYFNSSGASYPAQELQRGGAGNLETFCQIYLEEAQAEGVRAEVAFAQAMKETGWLRFGGIVRIDQFNFAGIGAVDGNAQGNCASFRDVRTGVRAQIQHLKAYASTEPLNNGCEDPRFNLVSRGVAPYVEWLGIKENPQGVGWASAANYGIDIVNMIKIMKTM